MRSHEIGSRRKVMMHSQSSSAAVRRRLAPTPSAQRLFSTTIFWPAVLPRCRRHLNPGRFVVPAGNDFDEDRVAIGVVGEGTPIRFVAFGSARETHEVTCLVVSGAIPDTGARAW